MFIFKLSSWLDRYDPYWYSRLIALKATYITIILFIAGIILNPPALWLIMLLSGSGILLIEMPLINNHRKKDLLYLAYIIAICLSVGLFSSSYLKEWFVLVAAGSAFVLYSLLRQKPQLFSVASGVLILALISLKQFKGDDLFSILNNLAFILEFAVITFWAHKLFPNYYNFIWLSAVLRNVESWQQMLQSKSFSSVEFIFKPLMVAQNCQTLLNPQDYAKHAKEFYHELSYYQYYLINLLENQPRVSSEIQLIKRDLLALTDAIRKRTSFAIDAIVDKHNTEIITKNLAEHAQIFAQLQNSWNQLCTVSG